MSHGALLTMVSVVETSAVTGIMLHLLFRLSLLQALLYRFHLLLIVAKIAAIARREPHVERVLKHIEYREDDFSIERIARLFLVAEGAISHAQQEQRKVEEDTRYILITLLVTLKPVEF